MPSLDVTLAFLTTTLLFACMPGPAMLYTAARTMARGRRAGIMAVLGLHLGGYFHVIAATAGLSTVFHLVPVLYTIVKLAGAAYLIWLGIVAFRCKERSISHTVDSQSGEHPLIESVVVEVLNPKTAIFFLAFLPQFVDPTASFPIPLQFLVLGAVVNFFFSSTDVVCVLLASALVKRLTRSDRVRRLIRRAGGAMLVGLGAHLALQRT